MNNFRSYIINNKYRILYLLLLIILNIWYIYMLIYTLLWMIDWPYEEYINEFKIMWIISILLFFITNIILYLLTIFKNFKIKYLYIYIFSFTLFYFLLLENFLIIAIT